VNPATGMANDMPNPNAREESSMETIIIILKAISYTMIFTAQALFFICVGRGIERFLHGLDEEWQEFEKELSQHKH